MAHATAVLSVVRSVQASKRNGSKGGLTTAQKHGAKFCESRSRTAGSACLRRYGNDFYRYINSLRKNKRGGNSKKKDGR